MLQSLLLLVFVGFSRGNYINVRVITAVSHGLERSLNYIDKHLDSVNVDCLLGVSFAAALLKDAYLDEHGHIMDRITSKIHQQAVNIIQRASPKYVNQENNKNGEKWKFQHLVEPEIWFRKLSYKSDPYPLLITARFLLGKLIFGTSSRQEYPKEIPNTDFCMQNIVNVSGTDEPTLCSIDKNCYNAYFKNSPYSKGYEITHRLLLIQLAKQRKCIFEKNWYRMQSKNICSVIMSEILTAEHNNDLDRLFDVFMEQVFLCGYEGYNQFFQNRWLYFILKSQKSSGCFSDITTDNFKTRVKKDMNYFQDGCNDHSTGLGTAVLALYYNFIIKEWGEVHPSIHCCT